MGKVKDVLFGSPSKASSSSGNQNNDMLTGAFGGAAGATGQATGLMGSLLGANGQAQQTGALENFANSGGMKFLQNEGMRSVTSSKAASGLLNSGSFATALQDRGNSVASTYLNNYMSQVNEMGKLGLGAGGILADSGKESESKEKGAKKGIAGDIIKAAASASDPRLKTDIVHLGYLPNGLGWYSYDYVEGHGLPPGRQQGVMADEVELLVPEAYIPNFMGEYAGVDYSLLGN